MPEGKYPCITMCSLSPRVNTMRPPLGNGMAARHRGEGLGLNTLKRGSWAPASARRAAAGVAFHDTPVNGNANDFMNNISNIFGMPKIIIIDGDYYSEYESRIDIMNNDATDDDK